MKLKAWIQKKSNLIWGVLFLGILGVFLAVGFDYYYDLNDDVLMKDILAGNYTGTPEGHNIQMLWLLSGGISLFYRVLRTLPWYGIFLWGCQFGTMLLILTRSMKICGQIRSKLAVGVVETIFFAAMMMEHLVSVQYTITCAMLASAAVFWFLTVQDTATWQQFVKKQLPAVVLVFLAFLLRSEMLCLMLPLICVAGVFRWSFEDRVFTKENFLKYSTVFGLILLSLGIGQGTHMVAYSSSQWKAFNELFDQRTQLYDYQQIPKFETNQEFYESIGISKEEQILFENYNFGIDEEIDEKKMGQIASYAAGLNQEEKPFVPKLKEKLDLYVYRLIHGSTVAGNDYPWNYMTLLLYFAVFLLLVGVEWGRGKWRAVVLAGWKLLLLFAVRSSLWMYILMGERDPVRITHSLYFMEMVILGGTLFMTLQQRKVGGRGKLVCLTMLICVGVFSAFLLPEKLAQVTDEQRERQRINTSYQSLYQFCSEHPENFYFMDVYSSVSYSEKMFADFDHTLDNYDIMGGWACKSPLYQKKLQAFQIPTMEEGLLSMDNVYFIRKNTEDMTWLSAYYRERGVKVCTNLKKIIGEFEIYEVRRSR